MTLFDPTTIHATGDETGPREGKVTALRWQGRAGQAFPSSLDAGHAQVPWWGPGPWRCRGPSPLWGPIPVPLGCRSVPRGAETPGQEGWTPGWRVDPGRPAGLETQQGVHPGTGVGQGAPCPPRPCPLLTPLEPAAGLPWLPSTTACATPGPGPARPPTSRQFLERLQWELPPPPAGSPAACGGQTRSPGPSGIAPTSRKIAKRLKNK